MVKVLIIEDDSSARLVTKLHLRNEYQVVEASDGMEAMELLKHQSVDLIIADVMMPKMNGYEFVEQFRMMDKNTPVLFLTAKKEWQDKKMGFAIGIDDYMTKPFSPRELMLRISAILKRGKSLDSLEPQSIERDGIYIDLTARRVHVDGTLVSLTPKEFDLLALLASHPDVVFSRKKLLDTVWGGELPEDTRTLDTHIKQVRHAISPYSDRIVTLRGVGYRFEKT